MGKEIILKPDEESKLKRCAHCRKFKQLREFDLCKNTKDGRQSWCKQCHRRYEEQRVGYKRHQDGQGDLFDMEDSQVSASLLADERKETINKLKDEIDELNKKAAMPVKRVLAESKLRELPLVGDKVLRGLIPLLDKYGLYIDPSK